MQTQTQPSQPQEAPEVIHLGPTTELLTKAGLTVLPDSRLAEPVTILSDAMIEAYGKAVGRGTLIEVTDQASFDAAAEYLNNLTKFETMIKKSLAEKKAPASSWIDRVKALGDKLLDPLAGFKKSTNEKMSAWKAKVDRDRAAAIAAQQAETQRLLAENTRKEAERLKLEAQAKSKETEALAQLDTAKNDRQFNAGAAKFDASLALKAQAAEVVVPALPKDHASAQAAAVAPALAGSTAEGLGAPEPPAPAAAPAPTLIPDAVKTKGRGVKLKETAEILDFDLAKLPIRYHKLDEALLRKHILERVVTIETPGVTFKITEDFGGTGR